MAISKKRKMLIASLALMMSMLGVLIFQYSKTLAYNEKSGTVNADVLNVRTGAGTNNGKLSYNGRNVQLVNAEKVTIIDEAKASDGAVWYKIKFNYSKGNGVELTGYVHSAYIDVDNVIYTPDADFESYLTKQGFPESYKVKLRQLHAKYPNWIFVADNLSYDWNDVVKNESVLGRSLVHTSSISSWKSLARGAYNWETGKWATFDGSSWVAASEELVAYCMDPRNFLNETYIFQFEMLSYNSSIHKKSNVDTLLSGTFMSGTEIQSGKLYSTIFMEAGQKSGVSPYHLAARVKQEVGTAGTTGGVTGYYVPSTGNVYRNVYNFYNIGAYTANGRGAVENGLIWASKTDSTTLRPWNTKYNAIVGGAIYIGKGYINIGQDTVYYEKFDFAGTPYTHQYMTNILAPKSESVSMSKAYSSSMKNSVSLVFKIPVFKNMPANTCSCPTGDGSPNNILDKLIIDGYTLTPTFDKFTQNYDLIVANNVDSIKISASAIDSQASISGTGKIALKVGNNTIKVVVTAKNGNNRTYTLNVVRKAADNNNNPTTKPTTKPTQPTTQPTTKPQETTQPTTIPQTANYTTSYKILNNDYLTGIEVGTTAAGLSQRFTLSNCKLTVYKSDGKTKNDGIIGTGNRVIIADNSGKKLREFICVIYGDANGDGKISILDMTRQKRDILGISKLSGAALIAGDVNKNNGIDIRDMTQIKRDILGIKKISQ